MWKWRAKKMERTHVRLLESYFEFFYAKAVSTVISDVTKSLCDGCRYESLSQTEHICTTLTKRELLNLYFEEFLNAVDEDRILEQWDEAVKCVPDISEELIYLFRLKLQCKDWRETGMKTIQWRWKIIDMTVKVVELENRFS